MAIILDPQARINDLNRKIQNKREDIRRENRSYEALCQFKQEVERAQDDFNNVNGRDSQTLEPLQPFVNENTVIKKYARGMNASLNGIGGRVVGPVFVVLVGMINAELRAIYSRTVQYENQINWYKILREQAERELSLMNSGNE